MTTSTTLESELDSSDFTEIPQSEKHWRNQARGFLAKIANALLTEPSHTNLRDLIQPSNLNHRIIYSRILIRFFKFALDDQLGKASASSDKRYLIQILASTNLTRF